MYEGLPIEEEKNTTLKTVILTKLVVIENTPSLTDNINKAVPKSVLVRLGYWASVCFSRG